MGPEGIDTTGTGTTSGNGRGTKDAAQRALGSLPGPATAPGANTSPMVVTRDIDVKGRTLWLTRMPYGGSRMLAAAFRSIGSTPG